MKYFLKHLNSFFATICFSGKVTFMPGTVGSVISFILLELIFFYTKINYTLLFISSFIVAMITIHNESNNLNTHDHKSIVIDEFIGVLICFIYIKINHLNIKDEIFLIVCFRFFDIIKPFPINYIDKKIKNSFGIILDDVVAALFAIISFKILKLILI